VENDSININADFIIDDLLNQIKETARAKSMQTALSIQLQQYAVGLEKENKELKEKLEILEGKFTNKEAKK
jgi:polyhydroxyalkanoate synthesis regulator phasin